MLGSGLPCRPVVVARSRIGPGGGRTRLAGSARRMAARNAERRRRARAGSVHGVPRHRRGRADRVGGGEESLQPVPAVCHRLRGGREVGGDVRARSRLPPRRWSLTVVALLWYMGTARLRDFTDARIGHGLVLRPRRGAPSPRTPGSSGGLRVPSGWRASAVVEAEARSAGSLVAAPRRSHEEPRPRAGLVDPAPSSADAQSRNASLTFSPAGSRLPSTGPSCPRPRGARRRSPCRRPARPCPQHVHESVRDLPSPSPPRPRGVPVGSWRAPSRSWARLPLRRP